MRRRVFSGNLTSFVMSKSKERAVNARIDGYFTEAASKSSLVHHCWPLVLGY